MLVILRRVVWVTVGCGAWAPSQLQLHLTWRRWRVGGRTLVPFLPLGPKLHGCMQSRWELNCSPRAQLPWKMTFQPSDLHSKHCFSHVTYSENLCFFTTEVLRLEFSAHVYHSTSSSVMYHRCHVQLDWSQEQLLGSHEQNSVCPSWLWPTSNHIASGFVSSAFVFICSELLSSQLLKLKVDKRAWTTGFLQLSKYWFTSGFCKKMTSSPTNI